MTVIWASGSRRRRFSNLGGRGVVIGGHPAEGVGSRDIQPACAVLLQLHTRKQAGAGAESSDP